MKFGYSTVNNADGIHPRALGVELEQRGFDSLWLPEHSHIPVGSVGLFPDPKGMPDGYPHMMNPFISLMAAAADTTRLKLCTGMSLALEHDLLDLACMTATLDVLSGGRLILGIGAGWNTDELMNHRPDIPFSKRYTATKERVSALRTAWGRRAVPYDGPFSETDWGSQISAFDGEFDHFTPSWIFPKPKAGTIPIALGLAGPVGMKHAASYADIWAPVDNAFARDGVRGVAGGIRRFHETVEEVGRDPRDVSITIFVWAQLSNELIENYSSLGVERVVFAPPTYKMHSASDTLRRLDELQPYIDGFSNS